MKKLDYNYIKNYIESFGERLISKEYKNCYTKLEIKCKNKKHIYLIDWTHFKRGENSTPYRGIKC